MNPKCRSQAGLSKPPVLLILGVFVIALTFFRRDITKAVFPKDPSLQVTYKIERETHMFVHDTYYLDISAYHEADEPINGYLQFVVHGDCKFHPPDAESMKDITLLQDGGIVMQAPNWEAGAGHAKVFRYELVSSGLSENGLSNDEVEKRIFVGIAGEFHPRSDSMYRKSGGIMFVGKLPNGTDAKGKGEWKNS